MQRENKRLAKGFSLSLSLLFMTSCLFEKCDEWKLETISGRCPSYQAAKLFFVENRISNPFELEWRTESGEERLFLNLSALFIQSDSFGYEEQKEEFEMTVQFNDASPQSISAYVFEGGQRLLFSKEAKELIVSNLLEGNTCILRVGRREFVIPPSNLLELYNKFKIDSCDANLSDSVSLNSDLIN